MSKKTEKNVTVVENIENNDTNTNKLFSTLDAEAVELAKSESFTVGQTDGRTAYEIVIKSKKQSVNGEVKNTSYKNDILSVLMYRELKHQLEVVEDVTAVYLDALYDATKSDKDDSISSNKFNYYRVAIPCIFGNESHHLQIRRHAEKNDDSRVRLSMSKEYKDILKQLESDGYGKYHQKDVKHELKRVYLYVSFDTLTKCIKALIEAVKSARADSTKADSKEPTADSKEPTADNITEE